MNPRGVVCLATLVLCGCSQPNPRDLGTLLHEGEDAQYLSPETLKPYDGPVFRLDEADPTLITFRGGLKNGRLHGPSEELRRMDALGVSYYVTGVYQDGLEEGLVEWFLLEDQIPMRMQSETYMRGILHGPTTVYVDGGISHQWGYDQGEKCEFAPPQIPTPLVETLPQCPVF